MHLIYIFHSSRRQLVFRFQIQSKGHHYSWYSFNFEQILFSLHLCFTATIKVELFYIVCFLFSHALAPHTTKKTQERGFLLTFEPSCKILVGFCLSALYILFDTRVSCDAKIHSIIKYNLQNTKHFAFFVVGFVYNVCTLFVFCFISFLFVFLVINFWSLFYCFFLRLTGIFAS